MTAQAVSQRFETSTPWGLPHAAHAIAAGIVSYSTSTHGGIHLADERLNSMPSALREIPTYAESGWYEEDCDVNLVIISFPEHFHAYNVWSACRAVQAYDHHRAAAAYIDSPDGSRVKAIADAFERDCAHLYRRGSMSSSGSGWTVDFVRISDRHHVRAVGLTTDEAFTTGPVDIAIYGDRVSPVV